MKMQFRNVDSCGESKKGKKEPTTNSSPNIASIRYSIAMQRGFFCNTQLTHEEILS